MTATLLPLSSSSREVIVAIITDSVRKGDWVRGDPKGKMPSPKRGAVLVGKEATGGALGRVSIIRTGFLEEVGVSGSWESREEGISDEEGRLG